MIESIPVLVAPAVLCSGVVQLAVVRHKDRQSQSRDLVIFLQHQHGMVFCAVLFLDSDCVGMIDPFS